MFAMSHQQLQPNKSDLPPRPDEDAYKESRRKIKLLPGGAFLFEDVLDFKGSGAHIFVMCDAWLIELIELQSGEFSFMRGDECVRPSAKRFGTFYPPFTILKVCVADTKGRLTGMAATESLPEKFMTAPMMFETDVTESPQSAAQVREILNLSYKRQSIEINRTPSLLSRKAKKLIGENYLFQFSIARIAAQLGITHEHLTRQFKRDFGLSPSAYCHQVRIADATSRLARGEEIINVSQDVGYNDLSRFYKQFRKATTKTPGYCQASPKA